MKRNTQKTIRVIQDLFIEDNMDVNNVVRHKDGRIVFITDGAYYGDWGISNYWTWREVKRDGTLGKEESGYGWIGRRSK